MCTCSSTEMTALWAVPAPSGSGMKEIISSEKAEPCGGRLGEITMKLGGIYILTYFHTFILLYCYVNKLCTVDERSANEARK